MVCSPVALEGLRQGILPGEEITLAMLPWQSRIR